MAMVPKQRPGRHLGPNLELLLVLICPKLWTGTTEFLSYLVPGKPPEEKKSQKCPTPLESSLGEGQEASLTSFQDRLTFDLLSAALLKNHVHPSAVCDGK